jgi:hypothetical protein
MQNEKNGTSDLEWILGKIEIPNHILINTDQEFYNFSLIKKDYIQK